MPEYMYRAFATVRWEERAFKDPKPTVTVFVDMLPVLRRTPKGAWVAHHLDEHKETWVAAQGRKRYAQDTIEEALESLKQRNKRHRAHLRTSLRKADAIKDAVAEGAPAFHLLKDGCYVLGEPADA